MKINKSIILYILIIIVMLIGSISKLMTYVSLLLSVLFAFVIGFGYQKDNPKLCFGLILLLCFQNLCIGIGAHLASNTDSSLRLITQIPFMTIGIIFIIVLLRNYKNNKFIISKEFKWPILYFICIILSFFIGRGSINSILINARNMTVFYMAYFIGKNYFSKMEHFNIFYKDFTKLMYFVFFAGIILLIFGYDLYKIIGMGEVYIAKGGTIFNDKLDSRFNTSIFSFKVIRMGSIYYEPVNLAYFFAFGVLINLYYYKKNYSIKIINLLISSIGLFLTYGKGGYLIVLLTIIYIKFNKIFSLFLHRISRKNKNRFTIILLIFMLVLGINLYIKKYPNNPAMPHINQIEKTFSNIIKSPLGHGLGTGGNMGKLFNDEIDYNEGSGQETALLSFFYQIGIQGILCLFMCFKKLFDFKLNKNEDSVFEIAYILPYILLTISLFQENTFTPQCIVIYMIFIGAMNSIYKNKNQGSEN